MIKKNDKDKLKYLNALNLIEGVGTRKLEILMGHFQSPENIWTADIGILASSGIPAKLAEKIFLEKKQIDPDQEWEKLAACRIEVISLPDDNYPKLLREIHRPPYIIYKRGNFDLNSMPMLSVVGSRKYSQYGAQTARTLSGDLARAGLAITSGMAIGIDTIAHRAAIDCSGQTIAVLGNSLEDACLYPRENYNLAMDILENGALLSEFPLGTKAGRLTFPMRNRLIAGLSRGLLVIEAGEKSGALITARYALDYSRDIFAVPGSIFSPVSCGCNGLIKSGAKLVTCAKDVLEEFDLSFQKDEIRAPKIPENYNEEILLKVLSVDPIHIDNISRLSKLETMTVSGSLSMMEIKGWVKNVGGQNYILL